MAATDAGVGGVARVVLLRLGGRVGDGGGRLSGAAAAGAPSELDATAAAVMVATARGVLERHHMAVLHSADRFAASVRAAVGELYARLESASAATASDAAALKADLAALRGALHARYRRVVVTRVAKVGL